MSDHQDNAEAKPLLSKGPTPTAPDQEIWSGKAGNTKNDGKAGNSEKIYPDLPQQYDEENPEHVEKCPANHYQSHQSHQSNINYDWSEEDHFVNQTKVCWALILGIIGMIVFFPLCIIGLCFVSNIKRNITRRHEHWCKVNTTYWINVFGLIFGIIEYTVVILSFVYERH